MRSPRIARAALAIVVAMTAAGGGAAVNLALLEPGRGPTDSIDLAGSGASTTTTRTSTAGKGTTTSTAPPTSPTAAGSPPATDPVTTSTTRSYTVSDAGEVVLSAGAGRIVVESVRPAPGWTYQTEAPSPDELEISFRRAEDGEATLHATLQDGQLRVVIEAEGDGGPDD